ncbi:Glutathione synthetase large chain [Erysiphe neolycopersici]|uniref:Glutathione synthetase n=1 Tax=Erysiphe neolycopersici TaxID=212602 RepID=A0A420HPZ7_9PEZI|nr:Glutathione synthetase large chain [Erysiphe neolycopersici]
MAAFISKAEQQYLVSVITDWSLSHGLAIKSFAGQNNTDSRDEIITTVPLTLFPSPFPRTCFEQARDIQRDFNLLYASISQDEDFLRSTIEKIIDTDSFIAKLWNVHLKVKEEGYTQDLSLGLFRSDYMVSDDDNIHCQHIIKQVEFNTIAASFAALSSRASELHRHSVNNRFLAQNFYYLLRDYNKFNISDLPENKGISGLAFGLETAFNEYVKNSTSKETKKCIIFLIQNGEQNIFDQHHLEYALKQRKSPIPVFRLSFSQIYKQTKINDTPNRELLYFLPTNPTLIFEVAVVYFRAGYGPLDYPDQSAWDGRFQLERSNAIKCPSILTQLAGSKKVQQVLVTSGFDRFLTADESRLSKLQNTFTNIYPLDDSPAGLKAQKFALDTDLCRYYVLKPQREGGGNNIYRSAIPDFLRSIPKSQWKSYILMKIIKTPKLQNIILRNGNIEKGSVVSELGIFGTCLWNHTTHEIIHNEEAGYLLRSKGDQSEEGGVAIGYGCIDSCRLV